jgi:HAD superfamily phosphatase (TIGR01668 family)
MFSWLNRLWPDEYVESIAEVDLDKLWNAGYRLILTDLDNTLVPWNYPDVTEDLARWLEAARGKGFQVCILSNNKGPRVKAFAEKANVSYIASARKPKSGAYREALSRFGATPQTAVMIGDQLFTDIQGGKRCGIYTILVLPIDPHEWWGTRVVRKFERIVMKMLERRGLVVPERKVKQR